MNKIKTFRTINTELKYNPIKEYIGIEIPIDISKKGDVIAKEIKTMIEENLKIKLKSIKDTNVEATIAKYGMIDIDFEIETEFKSDKGRGIEILKENKWIDKEASNEFRDEGFLDDLILELKENKNYLKIVATINRETNSWIKEKSYLMKQLLGDGKIKPLPEDKLQILEIKDMCFTNYSGIWLWKHFYL